MIVGRMAVSSGVASGENDRTRRPRGRHPCRGAGSLRLCRVPKLVLIPGAPLISILFLTQALNAVLLLPPWCSSASHRGERFAAGRQLSAPDSSAPPGSAAVDAVREELRGLLGKSAAAGWQDPDAGARRDA
jgi:hypothetical protein